MPYSAVIGLNFDITRRDRNGRPDRLRFEDGVEYDRQEMDMLNAADNDTKRQLHLVKKTIPGLIVSIDEVME